MSDEVTFDLEIVAAELSATWGRAVSMAEAKKHVEQLSARAQLLGSRSSRAEALALINAAKMTPGQKKFASTKKRKNPLEKK